MQVRARRMTNATSVPSSRYSPSGEDKENDILHLQDINMSECEDGCEDKEDDECHLRTILQIFSICKI